MFSLQKTNVLPLCTAKRLGHWHPIFEPSVFEPPTVGNTTYCMAHSDRLHQDHSWFSRKLGSFGHRNSAVFWDHDLILHCFQAHQRSREKHPGLTKLTKLTHPGLALQAADPSEQPALRVDWRRIPSSEITGRNHWSHWDGRQSIGFGAWFLSQSKGYCRAIGSN